MAIYIKTNIKDDEVVWCLVSPSNIFEALKMAWLMLRHQDRIAILAGVPKRFIDEHCAKEYINEEPYYTFDMEEKMF